MLKDMRWAYQNVDREVVRNSTPQRERFRTLLKEKPDEFLTMFQRMEREHKPAKKDVPKQPEAAKAAEVSEEKDVGAAEALTVLGRWLEEWQHAELAGKSDVPQAGA